MEILNLLKLFMFVHLITVLPVFGMEPGEDEKPKAAKQSASKAKVKSSKAKKNKSVSSKETTISTEDEEKVELQPPKKKNSKSAPVPKAKSLTASSKTLAESDEEIEELFKDHRKKPKVTHPVTLVRVSDASPIVKYAQQLTTKGKILTLNRESTKKAIQYVRNASVKDGGKSNTLAQGFCRSENKTWDVPFTITQSFLGVLETSCKKMVWVSQGSNANSDNNYFIRKPQTNYDGGHAEPQFIKDLEAAFTQNSEAVVKYFMPPADNKGDIYMCGLELFGPYDMCDIRDGKDPNKYDCVGKLLKFRKDHQKGQQSISKAIRDKLGDRFKGEREDAFVVIYHAQSPYNRIDSYKAEDDDSYYSLKFEFERYQFLRKKKFDDSYYLSQLTSIALEPDILYGYIHQIADKKANYYPKAHSFSFS